MRTYDNRGDTGMGIADFLFVEIYLSSNLIRFWMTPNMIEFNQFTAIDLNYPHLIAFNTFAEILKLEKTVFRGLQ